jgi:hypothetical protein
LQLNALGDVLGLEVRQSQFTDGGFGGSRDGGGGLGVVGLSGGHLGRLTWE